jgi:hypothetical protein
MGDTITAYDQLTQDFCFWQDKPGQFKPFVVLAS